ncbi:MAG: helix-turn-helix domain-containing protein [Acidobacteria bacterium]|nr:helix-turn-helix domain-containing protein [Acidobacteriota bacterium]
MHQRRLETVKTLAARFGLPRRTVVREVMNCRLPYVSIAGKWRFRERDIELWVDRAGPMPNLLLMQGGKAVSVVAPSPSRAESRF